MSLPFILEREDIRVARRAADAIAATTTMRRTNYTGLVVGDRYFHGYLGELGLCALLRAHGVRYEHRIVADGRSQRSEISLWVRGVQRSLDVKTATQAHHRRFMCPEAQPLDADLYAAVRLNVATQEQARGEWLGVLSCAMVRRLPIGDFGRNVPTRHCQFVEMPNPLQLLEVCDRQ